LQDENGKYRGTVYREGNKWCSYGVDTRDSWFTVVSKIDCTENVREKLPYDYNEDATKNKNGRFYKHNNRLYLYPLIMCVCIWYANMLKTTEPGKAVENTGLCALLAIGGELHESFTTNSED
jgi:hypothetical protein